MYKIQANKSGSKSIEVSDAHLHTIKEYALFKDLSDSHGIISETTLDKLKLNIRAMLESDGVAHNELLDLCLDVIYHKNMKAFALEQLMTLYKSHEQQLEEST